MPYLKKLKIKGKEYWYLFHTVRDKDKFRKLSKYIGKELPKNIEKLKQDFLDEIKKPKIKDKDTKLLESLTPLERKVLPTLKTTKNLDKIVEVTKLKQIEVMRSLQWLQNKELLNIKTTEKEVFTLDKNGKEVLEKGLPEKRFLKLLPTTMNKIREALTQDEFNVSIGKLKQLDAIKLGKQIEITEKGKQILKDNKLENILKSLPQDRIEDQDLIKRNLIKKEIKKQRTIELTKLGKELSSKKLKNNLIESLTPEMLSKRSFRNKTFRRYDITSNVPKIFGGRKHPLTAVMDLIRNIFIEMGFQEMKGPWVETAFWCMDSMWIPQDHPAREVQDTFYLPYKGKLPKKEIVDKVISAHETGGNTGSKGYGYKWNPEVAKQLLMRTHTTATTYRYFGLKDIKKLDKAKYFYIGRIFRNEAIDATHLAEFHQVEGFVMDNNLSLKNLMGFIKEFYSKMGLHKIKFKVTYNPYTESSLEALYYDKKRKKYIELINSGMFRPESLAPYGIKKPVVAWGLGVERLAMILYEKGKLKELLGPQCDLNWIRKYKTPIRKD